VNVPLTGTPPSLGSLHTVCVHTVTGSGTKRWTGDDDESLHCRAIVVIKP
jgi:hypothetical protein